MDDCVVLFLFVRRNNLNSDRMRKFLVYAERILTALTFLSYILVLVAYILERNYVKLIEVIALPGIAFVIVTIFRKVYNAPRPYEVTGVPPLNGKKTQGKSMPSRHVFSVFMIAMTLLFYYWPAGVAFLIAGVVLAFLRVIEGVHFAKDVIVGAAVGIGCGLIYLILP